MMPIIEGQTRQSREKYKTNDNNKDKFYQMMS